MARAKGVNTLSEAALAHMISWMCNPTTTAQHVATWSESGVTVKWLKKRDTFVVAPLS